MKTGKRICVMAAVGVLALMCTACGQERNDKVSGHQEQTKDAGQKTRSVEGATLVGMYLTFGEDGESYIFADVENDTLFYAEIPSGNLIDEEGKKISEDELQAGDMIAVYASDIVLETYPPKYPGVTKMVRIEKGTAEDAQKYEGLIAEIYTEPDPGEIPYLDIENRQTAAVVTSVVHHGTYEWSYTDENGERQAVTADAKHVLEWERSDAELVELTCDTDDKDLRLTFSKKPQNVKVTRWDSTADISDAGNGEAVKAELSGKEAKLKDAKPGSVYEVIAEWENGTVTYGFAVK